MEPRPGLRERKKERTRRLLAETAHRLFAERGFDGVTVVDIAREADVSPGTVFNYFPTKESLFYERMEAFEVTLVEAVRARPEDEGALEAFRRVMLEGSRRLERDEVAELIAGAARVVAASAALQAREREIVAHASDALAAVLREDAGAEGTGIAPDVVAHALMGVQRSLVSWVRERALAGERGPALGVAARGEVHRAFELLQHGLEGYAPRRAP